jgi:hypothetical protein
MRLILLHTILVLVAEVAAGTQQVHHKEIFVELRVTQLQIVLLQVPDTLSLV